MIQLQPDPSSFRLAPLAKSEAKGDGKSDTAGSGSSGKQGDGGLSADWRSMVWRGCVDDAQFSLVRF